MQRLKASTRRSRAVDDSEIEQMASTRMVPEHDHLNAFLDKE